jgi:hypothetical protein
MTVITSDPDVIVAEFKRTAVTGDEITPFADTATPVPGGVAVPNPLTTNQLAVAGLNVLEKTSS